MHEYSRRSSNRLRGKRVHARPGAERSKPFIVGDTIKRLRKLVEDETGAANLILYPRVYERFRKAARHSGAVVAGGKIERQGEVVHVMVGGIADLREVIGFGTVERPMSRDFH